MLHLSKKQTQTFQYARWRHQQKTYRWRKTKHVLSDNITTIKQNTKKQLNYWRVTVTPFVLIRLIMPPTLLEHWDINTKCSARKFTQPFLRSCQNPIEILEQFVLSHANLYI